MAGFFKEQQSTPQGHVDQMQGTIATLQGHIQDLIPRRNRLTEEIAMLSEAKENIRKSNDQIIIDTKNKVKQLIDEAEKKSVVIISDASTIKTQAVKLSNDVARQAKDVEFSELKVHERLDAAKKLSEELSKREKRLAEIDQALLIREQNLETSEKINNSKQIVLDLYEKELKSRNAMNDNYRKELESGKMDLELLRIQHSDDIKAFQMEQLRVQDAKKDISAREISLKELASQVEEKKNSINELNIENNRTTIEARMNVDNYRRIKQEAEAKTAELLDHKEELKRLIDEYNKKMEVK